MARVESRHTVSARPLHQRLKWIVGVNRAQFGLHRIGSFDLVLIVFLVQVPAQSDRRVSIDQARSHHRGS